MQDLKKKSNLQKQRIEKWSSGARGGENREKLVKGYKLSVIRCITSEDLR